MLFPSRILRILRPPASANPDDPEMSDPPVTVPPNTARRAVLTGSGVVTPFGDLPQSIDAIRERRSALGPVRAFDASSFRESRGGECHAFDARPWFRIPKALKLADQRTRLAVAAASMACAAAHLDGPMAANAGVLVGSSTHDMQIADLGRALGPRSEGDVLDIDYFGTRILRKLPPLWLLVNLPNMASAHVAIQLGAHGPNSTITTDWISGLQAIGEAARWIADGDADVVIAGGADCGVLPMLYATLDEEGYFGGAFVPGDGAALFVVEELEQFVIQRRTPT
ncbi:MAG: beta-ketoacyl synthase N-terminal-like domain-containing protein [Betaproteobacteria bacterium]